MIFRLSSLTFALFIGFAVGAYVINVNGEEETNHIKDSSLAKKPQIPNSAPQEAKTSGDTFSNLRLIENKLDQEIKHRQQLEKDLQVLRIEVRQLTDQLALLNPQLDIPSHDQSLITNSIDLDNDTNMVTQLINSGFTLERAEDVKRRFDKDDMDRLFLRDQAVREGWFGTSKFRQEIRELDNNADGLREELGDDDYDKVLYATGQFNRVLVEEVMAESPAQMAGIEAQDIILAYDDKRIFSWDELRNATTQGQEGDTILVHLIRSGEEVQLSIPRGPLGVKLNASRLEP